MVFCLPLPRWPRLIYTFTYSVCIPAPPSHEHLVTTVCHCSDKLVFVLLCAVLGIGIATTDPCRTRNLDCAVGC